MIRKQFFTLLFLLVMYDIFGMTQSVAIFNDNGEQYFSTPQSKRTPNPTSPLCQNKTLKKLIPPLRHHYWIIIPKIEPWTNTKLIIYSSIVNFIYDNYLQDFSNINITTENLTINKTTDSGYGTYWDQVQNYNAIVKKFFTLIAIDHLTVNYKCFEKMLRPTYPAWTLKEDFGFSHPTLMDYLDLIGTSSEFRLKKPAFRYGSITNINSIHQLANHLYTRFGIFVTTFLVPKRYRLVKEAVDLLETYIVENFCYTDRKLAKQVMVDNISWSQTVKPKRPHPLPIELPNNNYFNTLLAFLDSTSMYLIKLPTFAKIHPLKANSTTPQFNAERAIFRFSYANIDYMTRIKRHTINKDHRKPRKRRSILDYEEPNESRPIIELSDPSTYRIRRPHGSHQREKQVRKSEKFEDPSVLNLNKNQLTYLIKALMKEPSTMEEHSDVFQPLITSLARQIDQTTDTPNENDDSYPTNTVPSVLSTLNPLDSPVKLTIRHAQDGSDYTVIEYPPGLENTGKRAFVLYSPITYNAYYATPDGVFNRSKVSKIKEREKLPHNIWDFVKSSLSRPKQLDISDSGTERYARFKRNSKQEEITHKCNKGIRKLKCKHPKGKKRIKRMTNGSNHPSPTYWALKESGNLDPRALPDVNSNPDSEWKSPEIPQYPQPQFQPDGGVGNYNEYIEDPKIKEDEELVAVESHANVNPTTFKTVPIMERQVATHLNRIISNSGGLSPLPRPKLINFDSYISGSNSTKLPHVQLKNKTKLFRNENAPSVIEKIPLVNGIGGLQSDAEMKEFREMKQLFNKFQFFLRILTLGNKRTFVPSETVTSTTAEPWIDHMDFITEIDDDKITSYPELNAYYKQKLKGSTTTSLPFTTFDPQSKFNRYAEILRTLNYNKPYKLTPLLPVRDTPENNEYWEDRFLPVHTVFGDRGPNKGRVSADSDVGVPYIRIDEETDEET